jgi:hypothetical protein
MDQQRRKLVLASPMALGLALTGCGGGGSSPDAPNSLASGDATSAGLTAIDPGLIKLTSTDPAFGNAAMLGGNIIRPNGLLTQACRNGSKLYVCVTEPITIAGKSVSRTVMLTLDIPLDGTGFPAAKSALTPSQIVSGSVLINPMDRSAPRYDYKLATTSAAKLTLDAYPLPTLVNDTPEYTKTTTTVIVSDGTAAHPVLAITRASSTVTLTFSNLAFAVNTGFSGNAATKPLILSGTSVTLNVEEEHHDWVA